jgi:hypothetical protein
VLVLLYLFNPVLRSLRALQQASTLKNVQRKLDCSRASLGSLSIACLSPFSEIGLYRNFP